VQKIRRRGGDAAGEIAHGHTIASGDGEDVWCWTSPAGRRRLERRVALFAAALGLDAGPKRVLELGCGTGLYSAEMAPRCGQLVAADISEPLLKQARARVTASHVSFVQENLEHPRAATLGGPFDAAYGCSVLHHLNLVESLRGLRALLAPGASVAFSEPNLVNPQVRVMFSGYAWARKRWSVSKTEMAFTQGELAECFRRAGYEVVTLFPFDFMHPAIPEPLLPAAERVEAAVERVPGLRALAGSLFVHARVPLTPS